MEWLNIVVASVCSLIGALGGGSILYFRLNKQLKETEVVHNQADEWKRLYDEADQERKKAQNRIGELYKEIRSLKDSESDLKLQVQKLKWYHCTVNGCKLRKPPHVFDVNGNELMPDEAK